MYNVFKNLSVEIKNTSEFQRLLRSYYSYNQGTQSSNNVMYKINQYLKSIR
jgi:hypothetical protein